MLLLLLFFFLVSASLGELDKNQRRRGCCTTCIHILRVFFFAWHVCLHGPYFQRIELRHHHTSSHTITHHHTPSTDHRPALRKQATVALRLQYDYTTSAAMGLGLGFRADACFFYPKEGVTKQTGDLLALLGVIHPPFWHVSYVRVSCVRVPCLVLGSYGGDYGG